MSKDVNYKLINKRISQKIKLLKMYPNAWVYEFSNPIIRTNFRIPLRMIELANNAFKEFWGFDSKIDKRDIEDIERIIDTIEKKSITIKSFIDDFDKNYFYYSITELKNMTIEEKIDIIKNSRAITEILIPSNSKFENIYEAMVLIDKYDLPIKQQNNINQVEKWIELVKCFKNELKSSESEIIKKAAEKLNPNIIGRYKALRNEIVKYNKLKF